MTTPQRTVNMVVVSIAALTAACLGISAVLALHDVPFNEFATIAAGGMGGLGSLLARTSTGDKSTE